MDTVARLHRCLVDAIRRDRPDRIGQPITVAQIYQELIPYRAVRAEIGVELIADYEHALLRLLAGEGGYARLEPDEVRETLSRELGSPNPDVTAFRDYAACDVLVEMAGRDTETPESDDASWTPDWVEAAAEALYARDTDLPGQPEPPPEAASAATRLDAAPAANAGDQPHEEWEPDLPPESPAAPEHAPPAPAPAAEDASAASTAAAAGENLERELPLAAASQPAPGTCTFCREELPPDRRVRFCPFCGADQSRRPCPACGEILEPDWRFCIGCGAPAPEPAAPA